MRFKSKQESSMRIKSALGDIPLSRKREILTGIAVEDMHLLKVSQEAGEKYIPNSFGFVAMTQGYEASERYLEGSLCSESSVDQAIIYTLKASKKVARLLEETGERAKYVKLSENQIVRESSLYRSLSTNVLQRAGIV